jgi:hypothetical protein
MVLWERFKDLVPGACQVPHHQSGDGYSGPCRAQCFSRNFWLTVADRAGCDDASGGRCLGWIHEQVRARFGGFRSRVWFSKRAGLALVLVASGRPEALSEVLPAPHLLGTESLYVLA